MDVQQFLAEFGHIAGGVARLRELVLTLATRGQLLPQQNDEPASALIDRIRLEKDELIRQGVLKRGKVIAPIERKELPHQLPSQWAWVRLGTAAKKITDGTHHSPASFTTGDFKYLTAKNIKQWGIDLSDVTYVPASIHEEIYSRCDPQLGDILYIKDGATTGVLTINTLKEPFSLLSSVGLIKPSSGLTSRYLALVMRSPLFYQSMRAGMKGVAITRVTLAKLEAALIPLPPLAEQSRIVAKVDELMALCDTLESLQQARRKLQNNLRQSTLQAVASATSPHELQTTWARLADNFGRLFHAPEDVADLRKMASELAIRGALDVFSEPTDTSTVDAYLAELARRKSGKRFAKSVQVDEDIPLPNGWRWVLLEDLLSDSESGWSPKCEAEPRRDGEWGVLKVSAVTWGAFNPDENKRLPLSLEARPECEVKPGDFMLSRANTAELVARSVIAPDDCPEKLLMSDKIVRLNFLDDALKPWMNLVNNSDLARTYYKERATGTSDSMRNVSRQVIHELPIPLPSLKVQERVLVTLSRLLRYCDSLEQQAASRMSLSAQFSASAVASLTGIATEQEIVTHPSEAEAVT